MSVRVSRVLQRELEYEDYKEFFWIDSEVVSGYINNDARHFHTFVANRVQEIREHSDPSQWLHMGTKSNPADDDSRGLDAKDLNKGSRWINGPTFLWKLCQDWREINQTKSPVVSPDDKELKRISTFTSITKEQCELTERLVYFSNWFRASKALALYLK